MDEELLRGSCPACEAGIGKTHADDCDVAECLACGLKRMHCPSSAAKGHDPGRAVWTGDWPGHRECRQFGWHIRWDADAGQWKRCAPDVPGSGPDLTRLYRFGRWDADARRWRRRPALLYSRAMRGGRATVEEITEVAERWCAEVGYEVVGQYVGTRGWREAIADVADGAADLVVVPSVERLGLGKQVFDRIRAVRDAGGDIAGPGVQIDASGRVMAARLSSTDEVWERSTMDDGKRSAFDVAREALLNRYGTLDPDRMRALGADEVEVGAAVNIARRDGQGMARERRVILACPPVNINELLAGTGTPPYVPTIEHSIVRCVDCRSEVWIGPRQRQAALAAPEATLVLCMPDAIAETARRGQPAIVGHLGGGDGRPRLPG
ncbi:hypothetical protein [Micromonospora sp. KC721]|uniref:hypothetical protein n=1 Tax=Micromonospora sp. KC721 TaxID=2530380 RepID=UPI00104EE727|nr:hypothetical protein [Micromonospora sp. KC721]TDB79613.1 hypothetical protein E1182_12030 [Micromonospora sp. KC721]